MKRFEFRLARLKRVRIVREEIARGTWQEAEALARTALDRVEGSRSQLEGSLDFLRQLQESGVLEAQQVLNARRSIELQENSHRILTERARQARAAADEARKSWESARSELEGLERLEKKAQKRFLLNEEREESKNADQLAMERAARKKFKQRKIA